MRLKIGVIQKIYKQPRFEVEGFDTNRGKTIGFCCPDAEFLLFFLKKYLDEIESVEMYANATPVPPEMLEVVGEIKEIVGEERCI